MHFSTNSSRHLNVKTDSAENGMLKDYKIKVHLTERGQDLCPFAASHVRLEFNNGWNLQNECLLSFGANFSDLSLETCIKVILSDPLKQYKSNTSELKQKIQWNELSLSICDISFPIIFDETDLLPKREPMLLINDVAIGLDNLVEAKTRRLARMNASVERNTKPDAATRDLLHDLIFDPSNFELKSSEKDLIYRFRYYLSREKRALIKFLKCVTWTDSQERKEAIQLMHQWSQVDVEDVLELLGPGFMQTSVREYAISQLQSASDEQLSLYLLQLVQAIKFEALVYEKIENSPLLKLLLGKALLNSVICNNLYWFLLIECQSKTWQEIYAKCIFCLMKLVDESENGVEIREMFKRQGILVEKLVEISSKLKNSRDNRSLKIQKLREYIADPLNELANFYPLSLPLDPLVQVIGIVAEKCTVFNSVLSPLKLVFKRLNGTEYELIFKNGDDLRQDQLLVQMITLMDNILLHENMDLKLTPYKVMATGYLQGMIQFIPSMPLANILGDFGSIESYFNHHKSDLDAYIKSSAGYCVITWLLGVGDRHLDNLLLTPQGRLFHIDFSFILGRDPKPFPPPMKLCKEMIDVMGGQDSLLYKQFKSFCFTAFITLRKSSNLILNLFQLMSKAEIPDIQLEPDKAVAKVQEKFRLDLSDEEAIAYFDSLINESVRALFPQVMERIHSWAQYWRS